jgi:hypothetical protein
MIQEVKKNMSKDDWPSYRASEAYEHKLAYQQAMHQSDIEHITKTTLFDASPTYSPYRVISQELDVKYGCQVVHAHFC